MKKISAIALCLFSVLVQAAAAGSPAKYHFHRKIEWTAPGAENIVAFNLDSDIYASTEKDLADLRIYDVSKADNPIETPYQLQAVAQRREVRVRHVLSTEIQSLKENGKNIEITLKLPKKSPPADGFHFNTPLKNFERKVRISGSDDGQTWTPLVEGGLIFDYSRYMDVSNFEVALPENSFRQFKIMVEDVNDEQQSPYKALKRIMRGDVEQERLELTEFRNRALRINRIDMVYYVANERVEREKKTDYPIVKFQCKQDAKEKRTIITVATLREPLTSFTLETPGKNFIRRASVETPLTVRSSSGLQGHETEWREIGSATLSKLDFRGFHREQLKIEFPEHREAKYRIVVHNQDNPPLDISAVKAEGNVYHALFLAQQGKSYCVFYGSDTAKSPQYEAAAVLAALGKGVQTIDAQLGAQIDNAKFAEESHWLAKLLNNWFFLGTAIAIMTVALGWGLYSAGRRLDQLPKD
ncbi:MAG: DUF3999 family protein [Thermoguttaceae bacterium]